MVNFEGLSPRECGEHRHTGNRAWCLDCGEWCSPAAPCVRCRLPALEAEIERLREHHNYMRGVVTELLKGPR